MLLVRVRVRLCVARWVMEFGSTSPELAGLLDTFTSYRYNSSGVFIGLQKVTSTLELGESGDEYTAHSGSKFSMRTAT